jgi:HEAT repeat protein
MKKIDKLAESYRILGVSPGASMKQVKTVFHEKALLYHPDANPGAAAAAAEFKNITCAYGIIRDHLKKQAADKRQQAAEQTRQQQETNSRKQKNHTGRIQEENSPSNESAPGNARATAADIQAALDRHRNRKLQERDAQVGEMAARLSPEELGFRLEHSENPYVRLHAVRALAVQGGKPAAWPIIRALADTDPDVARTAAQALGALRTRAASMPLIRLHQKSGPQTQQITRAALARINSPLARRFLASLDTQQSPSQEQKQTPEIA